MRLFSLIVIVIGFSLAGCSKDSGGGTAPVVQPKARELSKCTSEIIEDWNKVYNLCTFMKTRADGVACKPVAQNFIKEYPDVACRTQHRDQKADIIIDSKIVQNIIDALTADGI